MPWKITISYDFYRFIIYKSSIPTGQFSPSFPGVRQHLWDGSRSFDLRSVFFDVSGENGRNSLGEISRQSVQSLTHGGVRTNHMEVSLYDLIWFYMVLWWEYQWDISISYDGNINGKTICKTWRFPKIRVPRKLDGYGWFDMEHPSKNRWLDGWNIFTGNTNQFDGKKNAVSGVDFPFY